MSHKAVIVDSHCHIGDVKGMWGHKKHNAEQHLALMDSCGVDKAIVFSFCSGLLEHQDFVRANGLTSQAVQEGASRLIGFCVVNPMFADRTLDEMKRSSAELGLKGLKLHPVLHGGYPVDDEMVFPAIEQAIQLGWPVVCHTDLNNQAATPYRLVRLAKRYPEVTLIMAHMGLDPAYMEASIQEAKDTANVYVDTSAITDSPGIIARAVAQLGSDRVLFGTDAPGLSMELGLRKVELADLEDVERRHVLGENALEILDFH